MARPGTGYQISFLPDGSILISQMGTFADADYVEWDEEEAAAGGLSIPVAMHHYTKNIGV